MSPAFVAHADHLVDPSPPVTELMGATGLPDPATNPAYVSAVDAYIQANLPGTVPVDLNTPEELAPMYGTETYEQSVAQGVADLNTAITPLLGSGVGVLGVSQSADIASREMVQLDPVGTPSSLPVSFVLLGDDMNPDGGILERFPNLNVAGITSSGATPADDFPTAIYTHEYDGLSDFCQYVGDVVCDANAMIGMAYDHSYTAQDLTSAFTLATQGATETTYHMIPTTDLPLLEPLRDGPLGNAIADLLQPDLTAIVNLGYGDPDFGYSTGPANVPTPAELLPPINDFEQLLPLLASGTTEGIQNFITDITAALSSM